MAPQIIGLGMACLDLLVRMKDMPTWERGTRLYGVGIEGGGPVATAMAAASKLGAPSGFVGTYGSDRLGAIKMQTLAEYQVDTSRCKQRPIPENQVVLVTVHAGNGERVFSGTGSWGTGELRVDELEREYITSADFLHLDGYHADAALQAARWMKAAGKRVMLDGSATSGPISDSMRLLVEQADILICGTGFGPALSGCVDLWDAGEAILKLGPKVVVQTEGQRGSYTVTPGERFHTPAFEVDVLDTTGAGDVFHGAYLVAMLRGFDAHQAARFSTAVSAIKCTRLGGRSGIPSFEEALRFLAERGQSL